VSADPVTPKSLGKRAKRGAAWSFVREGVTEVLIFPSSMVLARLLTPEEFGIAAAANFFTLLAARLSDLGFNAALIRSKTTNPVHMSTVFVINLVVGGLMSLALTMLAPFIADFYRAPETARILPIASLAFVIVPFGTVQAAILSREMRYRETTLVDWFHTTTFAATTVLFAWLGFGYMSMVLGRLAALTAMTVSRMAFARWRPRLAFSWEALRELFPFGAGVQAKRLLDNTAQNIDNLLVGRFLGMEALGFYDKAFSTMNRVLVRMNTGGPGVTYRIFAIIHDDPERFRRAYGKVVMSTSLMAFPVFAGLAVAAPQFLEALFGRPWRPAAAPFQVLCLAGCLKLLNTYASSANQAAGRVWSEVWRQLVYLGLIAGSIVALRRFGPFGAALGVMGSTAIMAMLMHVLLIRSTHVRLGDLLKPQIPALLCAIGVAVVELLVHLLFTRLAPNHGAWPLVLTQAAAAMLFFAIFILFAPLPALRRLVHDVATDLVPVGVRKNRLVHAYLSSTVGAAS
jgi:teichuronic acid exporter